MSFILDALKKSEAERQQQSGGEFSNVPSSAGDNQSTKWLWILAILLLFNITILLGLLLRPGEPPAAVNEVPAATAGPQHSPAQSFEQRVAQVQADRPAAAAGAAATDKAAEAVQRPPVAVAPTASTGARIRTFDELRLDGTLQLPDLHLDIHVFADDPAERFVFINMAKHRQDSQLAEGPVVSEITADGVILEYQGHTFLLPRE